MQIGSNNNKRVCQIISITWWLTGVMWIHGSLANRYSGINKITPMGWVNMSWTVSAQLLQPFRVDISIQLLQVGSVHSEAVPLPCAHNCQ